MPKRPSGNRAEHLPRRGASGRAARDKAPEATSSSDAPELDRRKTSVLGTIVEEYIATGEPVGSATLIQKYNLGVSSATVRAEMASLEEDGFLDQPHTSAGRVPSDRGYRYYVDRLVLPEPLSSDERERLRHEVAKASRRLDEIVLQASHVLSDVSRNIAFAIAPRLDAQVYHHLQLIWVAPTVVHAVLVTNLGLAAQATVDVGEAVTADQLTRACNNFNHHLEGKRLSEISVAALGALASETPLPDALLTELSELFNRHVDAQTERRLFAVGANNLLDQQEFRDLRKLRAILELLEEQRTLYGILHDSLASLGPKVTIGHELPSTDMAECSVVAIPYRVGGGNVGALGVLGPRRMPYGRLMSLLSCMADNLNTLFDSE